MPFKSEKIRFPLYGTPGKSVTRSGVVPNCGGVHCTGILGRVVATSLQPGPRRWWQPCRFCLQVINGVTVASFIRLHFELHEREWGHKSPEKPTTASLWGPHKHQRAGFILTPSLQEGWENLPAGVARHARPAPKCPLAQTRAFFLHRERPFQSRGSEQHKKWKSLHSLNEINVSF